MNRAATEKAVRDALSEFDDMVETVAVTAIEAFVSAALPAEQTNEMSDAMLAGSGLADTLPNRVRLADAYSALRAHLLGEDDITEDRRPWDEYAGEDA